MQEKNPFKTLGSRIADEWMKVERFLNQCKGNQPALDHSKNLLEVVPRHPKNVSKTTVMNRVAVAKINRQTVEEDIPSFVAVVQPRLDALDAMIYSLNMKDPTKC